MVRALLAFASLLIMSGYAAAAPFGSNSGVAAPSGQQGSATSRRWSYDHCYATYRERSDAIGQALRVCKEERCVGAGMGACKDRCIGEFSQAMSLLGDSTKRCLCSVYVENTLLGYIESDPRFGGATPQQWNQQRKLLNDQCIARPPAEFK